MKQADKYLLIAPHGDDELNLFGTIAECFKKNICEMQLFSVTVGDYFSNLTNKRYHENMDVTNKIDFSKVTIIGYVDNPAFIGEKRNGLTLYFSHWVMFFCDNPECFFHARRIMYTVMLMSYIL